MQVALSRPQGVQPQCEYFFRKPKSRLLVVRKAGALVRIYFRLLIQQLLDLKIEISVPQIVDCSPLGLGDKVRDCTIMFFLLSHPQTYSGYHFGNHDKKVLPCWILSRLSVLCAVFSIRTLDDRRAEYIEFSYLLIWKLKPSKLSP
jgi:hypothetical protein